jgi:hypothetical protein
LNKELKTGKMQVNKNNMDDLEYIAGLGFEQVTITDSDLTDLNTKIKDRIFSYNNGLYFGFISLLVGVLVGVSIFFAIDNTPRIYSSDLPDKILDEKQAQKKSYVENYVPLDTVSVVKENFINPISHSRKIQDSVSQVLINRLIDTAVIIQTQPINLSIVVGDPISESNIKYISNAPVVYIHGLKVTNYSTLYFKKNQFIKLPVKSGLPVSFANKEEYGRSHSELKQSADYYLHEEFSEALLTFNKGNFKECIYALNVISSYNDEDINCNFYLGMCYYYTKNYAKAMDYFNRCIENSNNTFLQEAMYYNALSLYESGNKEDALKKFKQIAEEGEFYSQKAKFFLKN